MVNYNIIITVATTFIFCCESIKVKVNNDVIMDAKQRVEEDDFRGITVTSLDFIKSSDWTEPVVRIENFDFLERISLDGNALIVVPTLEDVPNLKELSLNQNGITAIYTAHFLLTELSKISLANNLLRTIYNSVFNKELVEVNLKCNMLKEVKSAWFQKPENLQILDISNNKIKSIKQSLFRRFTQLTQLNLSGNQIKSIEQQSFSFESMTKLDLSLNLISELSHYIFTKRKVEINSLNVTYNRFNYIGELFLKKIYDHDAVKEISTFGNPWQCFCLRKIETICMKNKIRQIEPAESSKKPICVSSLIYPKLCMEALDEELYEIYAEHVKRIQPTCSGPASVASIVLKV